MNLEILILLFLSFLRQITTQEYVRVEIQQKLTINAKKPSHNGFTHTTSYDRLMASSSNRKINILFDFSGISTTATNTAVIQTVMNNLVLPRLQLYIRVSGSTSIPPFTTTNCDSAVSPFPSTYSSSPTNADLIVYIKTSTADTTYLAFGVACDLDSSTSRPNKGIMMINLANFLLNSADSIETLSATLIHEMHHILGFSPSLFGYYTGSSNPAQNTTVITAIGATSNILTMVSSNVLNWQLKHLNCNSLSGVPLEDQGTSASQNTHWEKTTFGNELMTSQTTSKPILSGMTLSLLVDSGWYQIDTSSAENLPWGTNQGCSFMNNNCSTAYSEFCSLVGARSCSGDFKAKTNCMLSVYSDACLINEFVANSNCNNGISFQNTSYYENTGGYSRCYQTNITGSKYQYPGCYMSQCVSGTVQVTINGNVFSCTSAGAAIVVDSKLTIICPDPRLMCTSLNNNCPGDCSGHGKCLLNGSCFCDLFHQGNDCSQNITCTYDPLVCNFMGVIAPSVTYFTTFSCALFSALFSASLIYF